MFEKTNFVIRQLQRLKKAMAQPALNEFAPDGRDVAYVTEQADVLQAALGDQIARAAEASAARAAVDAAWEELHQHCVSVAGAMRSVYRARKPALRAIGRIPSKDETVRATLARAAVTVSVWAKLPPMPNVNPPEPFKLGALTLASFKYFIELLELRMEANENCATELEFSRETLSDCTRACGEFVSAAVAQGRAQFLEGTKGRLWIDTIPLELGTQPPVDAEITLAESPAAGAVHLEFEARSATRFTIQTRRSSDVEFVTVAEGVEEEFWDAADLPAGEHQYIVLGVNSRGTSPPSAVAVVMVGAAAAEAKVA